MIDVTAYLERIGYTGPVEPSLATLRELHRAHMFSVPFENLDIHIPREIVLDVNWLQAKIVGERRGGFCYELNGLFAALLQELGFDVTLLSARVPRKDGSPGPEFDHLLLRVDLDEPWLADVGFGDSFHEPLRLDFMEQEHAGQRWRVEDNETHLTLQRSRSAGEWAPMYTFTLQPRDLVEFIEMCRFHQTSPESHFTRNRIITILTEEGRISLSDDRLYVRRNGQREEFPIEGDKAWRNALAEHFGIALER